MEQNNTGKMNFFLEMSEQAITTHEFFSPTLLDSLERHFGYRNILILCFDTNNHFLSWIDRSGLYKNCEGHPYGQFAPEDVIRQRIYQDALEDHLTYFNVNPRLYRSTDLIPAGEYESSAHVRFLEEYFHAHYSVHFAMGINAYLQIVFLKSFEEGDFSEAETAELTDVYSYVASAYRSFKTYEQSRIISDIQDQIIRSGETAYMITDDFLHVMDYNEQALTYLTDILGSKSLRSLDESSPSTWLPFLLSDREQYVAGRSQMRTIQNYTFKINIYDQAYSHGIVDRYYWITIRDNTASGVEVSLRKMPELTKSERRVAALLYRGMTYQAIADELMVSYHTVKNHVQNIYTKCGVSSRYELFELMKSTSPQ